MIYPDRSTTLALAYRHVVAGDNDCLFLAGASLLHVQREGDVFHFDRQIMTDFPVRRGQDQPAMGCTRETLLWLVERLRPDHTLVGWRPDLTLSALFRAAREEDGAAELTPALRAIQAALTLDPVTVADIFPADRTLEQVAHGIGVRQDHLDPAVQETAWAAGDVGKLARTLKQKADAVWWVLATCTLPLADAELAARARRRAGNLG